MDKESSDSRIRLDLKFIIFIYLKMIGPNCASIVSWNQILFVVLLVAADVKIGGSQQYEYNPAYKGPTDCADVLRNHYEQFSEYPPDDATNGVNFLQMGDLCSLAAEEEFINEMRDAYLKGKLRARYSARFAGIRAKLKRWCADQLIVLFWLLLTAPSNEVRMLQLRDIWERWRAETSTGSISGKRVCNPRRLLQCHTSITKCVCRKSSFRGVET